MEQKDSITEVRLSRDVTQLFDTIYDLCGENSPILTEIQANQAEAERVKEEKQLELEKTKANIDANNAAIQTLTTQGQQFRADLKGYDRGDYKFYLDELGIDYDPQQLLKMANEKEPKRIAEEEEKLSSNTKEKTRLEKEIEELGIKIKELGQAYDQALRDRDDLNKLLSEVREGNEQITKAQIVNLGRALHLTEEQINLFGTRLLFSDDLKVYDAKVKNSVSGKGIGEVFKEAQEAATIEAPQQEAKKETAEEPVFEEAGFVDQQLAEESETIEETPAEEPVEEINILNEAAQAEENVFTINGLDMSSYTKDEIRRIENAKEGVVSKNLAKAQSIGIDDLASHVPALTDKDFVAKVELLEDIYGSSKDVKLNIAIVYDNTLSALNDKLARLKAIGLDASSLPLTMLKSSLDNFISNIGLLNDKGIKLDEKELKEFSASLYVNKNVFEDNLDLLEAYDIDITKQSGKLALAILAQPTTDLASKIDAVIEAKEEDILRLNPEYLGRDTYGILARIEFLKANAIDYRNNDEKKKYKRLIEDPIQFRSELGDVRFDENLMVSPTDNNSALESTVGNDTMIDALNELYNSDNLPGASVADNQDIFLRYSGIAQMVGDIANETEQAYVIDGVAFSINKFQRNLTQLLAINPEADVNEMILVALLYNSQKTEEEMRMVAQKLGFNRAMRGE